VSASVNPTAICVGSGATLSALGATNYTWNPGAMTGSSAAVSPGSTTQYTVTGTTAGCSNSKTVTLVVNSLPVLTVTANNNPICSTGSSTLSVAGATGYVWQPGGSTSSSISVTPSSTAVYTVTGTNAAGCVSLSSYTMTVNPTPTLTAAASLPTICLNGVTTITVTGAPSYTTQPGVITGNNFTVSPSATTIYTITGATPFCSSTTTVLITVKPLPTVSASSSPTNLCTGKTATLTASGAQTYTWQPLNIANAQVTVNPVTTTVYTVSATSSLSCNNSTTISLLVSVSPTVSGSANPTVICSGSPATMTVTGGTTYSWLPGSLSGSNIVVTPTSTTIYTVTGGNASICTHSITLTVSVNPLPTLSITPSATAICVGSTATLNASGASNYTWSPGTSTTSSVAVNPTVTAGYTVTGLDANGCANTATLNLVVNSNPTISATAASVNICNGNSTTLTATGAVNYSWTPGPLTGATVTVTPASNTIYTLAGLDNNGCGATGTVGVNVLPNPVFTLSAANTSICIGETHTLTAGGATNYTWSPGALNGTMVVVNPTLTTVYTVIATNTTACFSTQTITAFVNPLPANVIATPMGTITCATPTIGLSGASSDPNVIYQWTGPATYTSSAQNPSVSVWGGYTLVVTNTITGCVNTATTTVPTDSSIPLVSLSPSFTITCSAPVGSLQTVHSTTNPSYSWTGPSGFTSTAASPTINIPGNYSLTLLDASSGCSTSVVVPVSIHTNVVVTSTVTQVTCTSGLPNNDGTIMAFNFLSTDRYHLVTGSSYTGNATYANAIPIPTSGILTSTLANPTGTIAYTVRFFDVEGCTKDTTYILVPVDCEIRTLGLAKSASLPSLNEDGSYNVTYTISARNYDISPFTALEIKDDLTGVFGAPASFTVITPPAMITSGTLGLNNGYDGKLQTSLTNTTSALAVNATESFSFTIRVAAPLFFVPYYNSATGTAKNGISATVRDTSNAGTDTSPFKNARTAVTFTPNIFFGLTKEGAFNKLDDNSYDVTYTISVHNLGNDTLKEVVVKDSLLATFIHPAEFSVKNTPVVTGGLTSNNLFDGKTDLNLISPQSTLAPGTVARINFVVNVKPDTVTVLINSAEGSAHIRPFNGINVLRVTDISNSGNDPDVNKNKVWNEPSDNLPTILILPNTYTLFVPEGFSPNDDGINDVLVIKGLPVEGPNSLTIFNRWGSRVYYHENYGQALPWDGKPNIAGTLGQGKLPQGTYYYILEMKGTGAKPVTGFIVLQY
jgi:gliding motility-associated-like protein